MSKWLNSPSKIKKGPKHFSARAADPGCGKDWVLLLESSGGQSLAAARMKRKQTHVCSMPLHHLCLTLPTPSLLSFAVSWDLFSLIFLPASPLLFPAPEGLGWLAHAVVSVLNHCCFLSLTLKDVKWACRKVAYVWFVDL